MERSQRKGRGRPKQDVIDVLRAKVWCLVVGYFSSMSATALEARFCSHSGNARRSAGLWSKYARGEVSPSQALVEAVEMAFPETASWFLHPLWRILRTAPATPEELKQSFYSLDSSAAELLVFDEGQDETFWRIPWDIRDNFRELLFLESLQDALAGWLLLMREAEFRQNPHQFLEGIDTWRLMRQRLRDEWPFSEATANGQPFYLVIEGLLEKQWSHVRYPSLPDLPGFRPNRPT